MSQYVSRSLNPMSFPSTIYERVHNTDLWVEMHRCNNRSESKNRSTCNCPFVIGSVWGITETRPEKVVSWKLENGVAIEYINGERQNFT